MRVTGNWVKCMGRGNTNGKMGRSMWGSTRMGKEKDLEYIIIRMEADMKVLGVKVCRMGLDLFF